ncbi:hypothetical protein [Fictibacillus arsenicus]|uniref:Uncharacterized protein n=1 Tax=Fictibacillus arsenicus TaxID=255247 RepID=A0A1V3GB09_9BACL|nr:hypothetical protein [Fictibacillus arsenicus]OOE14049.1 hypothetical protein UN64_02210 [Fictibacillus arsenicus]
MNSIDMAESLLVMESNSLKFNYALLHDSNIMKMLIPFAKEKISSSNNSEIMEMVKKESFKYRYTPDNHIRRNMIKELAELYGIPNRKLGTKQDTVEQCDRIINAMYEQMKKDNKKFISFSTNQEQTTKLEEITKFQMFSLIDSISDRKMTATQMKEMGDSLEDFLTDLPENQQKQIAEKLGVTEITSNSVQKLIATNGTAAVFAIIVQVAGFAFYTTLTSVVAGIFGLVGITLPFAVYVTLTSAVAVIANPLFMVPALILGGGGLLRWQNKKMKKAIAPIIMMQIMVSDQNIVPEWETFLDE